MLNISGGNINRLRIKKKPVNIDPNKLVFGEDGNAGGYYNRLPKGSDMEVRKPHKRQVRCFSKTLSDRDVKLYSKALDDYPDSHANVAFYCSLNREWLYSLKTRKASTITRNDFIRLIKFLGLYEDQFDCLKNENNK